MMVIIKIISVYEGMQVQGQKNIAMEVNLVEACRPPAGSQYRKCSFFQACHLEWVGIDHPFLLGPCPQACIPSLNMWAAAYSNELKSI